MIEKASKEVSPYIIKTPVEYSKKLSTKLGAPVYLKLECLQLTGSFKIRGALFRLKNLSNKEKQKGVVTCSAGNHGKAVAYVANLLGITARIYVPKNVDEAKYQGILSYGAEVIRSPFIGYDDTEELARQDAKNTEATFVSAFDDEETMAGNGGTLALEIFAQLPEIEHIILPVGGGGLGAGVSVYAKAQKPNCRITACQHKDSPGLKLSMEKGIAITKLPSIETIAGGIEGGIGANCFRYLQSRIDEVILVSEQEIKNALKWILEQHQYLIDPTAAASVAAAFHMKKISGPTVIILTGRNVGIDVIKRILNETSTI